ncbi:hypothetical protein BH09PSE6_BH09PSE6_01890 [soil metagenome]
MRTLLVLVMCAAAVVYGYTRWQSSNRATSTHITAQPLATPSAPSRSTFTESAPAPMPVRTTYACDGRIHCSQMTSCAEATFFLKNCPGTKMDGDHDGIPCEQQWCTGR